MTIPVGYVPELLRPLQGTLYRWFPWLFKDDGDITIGPIPAGVPVNLLANLQPLSETDNLAQRAAHIAEVVKFLLRLKTDLSSLPADASDDDARKAFRNLVPSMLALNKCPDFVVNRGHYFGTDRFKEEPALSNDDKRSLIEFIKTF